jgi:polyhydroxyalkanoate synthesis regulator phasin
MILYILIVFFILLILYSLFLGYKTNIVEGMLDVVPTIAPEFDPTVRPTNEMLPDLKVSQVYKNYDKTISHNTFMIAQENAGNIEILKQQVDKLMNIRSTTAQEMDSMQKQVDEIQDQLLNIQNQQQSYITQIKTNTSKQTNTTSTTT